MTNTDRRIAGRHAIDLVVNGNGLADLLEEIIMTLTLPQNLAQIGEKWPVLAPDINRWCDTFCKLTAAMKK